MTPGVHYLIRAAQLEAAAKEEANPALRIELEQLARAYRRLAEQAARNAETDIVYDTPPRGTDPSDQPLDQC